MRGIRDGRRSDGSVAGARLHEKAYSEIGATADGNQRKTFADGTQVPLRLC